MPLITGEERPRGQGWHPPRHRHKTAWVTTAAEAAGSPGAGTDPGHGQGCNGHLSLGHRGTGWRQAGQQDGWWELLASRWHSWGEKLAWWKMLGARGQSRYFLAQALRLAAEASRHIPASRGSVECRQGLRRQPTGAHEGASVLQLPQRTAQPLGCHSRRCGPSTLPVGPMRFCSLGLARFPAHPLYPVPLHCASLWGVPGLRGTLGVVCVPVENP